MEGTVEQVSANKSNDLKIDKHESHLVHVQLEVKTFNPTTGAKESEPFVQKFTPQEFKTANDNGHFRGYSVDILHDPSGEAKADLTADTEKDKAKAAEELRNAKNVLGDAGAVKKEDEPKIDPLKAHKDLVALPREELQARYEQVFGEKPDDKLTKPKLADAIIEKVESLEEEAAKLEAEGSTGTGSEGDNSGSF